MSAETILSGLVRRGIVTAIDQDRRMVRVKFQSEELPSGWLYVLQHYGMGVAVVGDGGHDHKIETAGSHDHRRKIETDGEHSHAMEKEPDHEHKGTATTWWMPRINDSVVCLYLPVFNGDGFVLGSI